MELVPNNSPEIQSIIDAVYVINMDHDTDRLAGFDTMMKKLNWTYTRQPGISGRKLYNGSEVDDAYQVELNKKYIRWPNYLTYNEIGCMLSHITLWEKVANDPNLNRIAIFEDDARTYISDDITVLLHNFYHYLHENHIVEPDMLYLGKCLDRCITYEKIWEQVYKTDHPLCLHSYIMTKKGAKILLGMGPYTKGIDHIPILAGKAVTLMTFHPSIFYQDIMDNMSNLRNIGAALNNCTECLISQQYIPEESRYFAGVALLGLVVIGILFIIFLARR